MKGFAPCNKLRGMQKNRNKKLLACDARCAHSLCPAHISSGIHQALFEPSCRILIIMLLVVFATKGGKPQEVSAKGREDRFGPTEGDEGEKTSEFSRCEDGG